VGLTTKYKRAVFIGLFVIACVIGYFFWSSRQNPIPEGLATGNGRMEATEINIATKLGGRIEKILVNEGDFVTQGQELAVMQTDVLEAQFFEAKAQYYAAVAAAARDEANVMLRENDQNVANAVVAQRETELSAGQRRLGRNSKLAHGVISAQDYDNEQTLVANARAALATAQAQVDVAQAAVTAARADVDGAKARIQATQATMAKIEADIKDCTLLAPRAGRIQYRIAQPSEVLPAGGRVLNLVDLSDVYMTIFLPTAQAGVLKIGSEARIVVDAAPDHPIPATVSFVASTAQFTPKTVDTPAEREKLMFRVKVKVDEDALQKYLPYVKTGLPGVAWVKTAQNVDWPDSLKIRGR